MKAIVEMANAVEVNIDICIVVIGVPKGLISVSLETSFGITDDDHTKELPIDTSIRFPKTNFFISNNN